MSKRDYGGEASGGFKRRFLGAGAYEARPTVTVVRNYGRRRYTAAIPPRYRRTFRRSSFYGRGRQALHIEKKFFDTDLTFNFDATGEVPATGQLALIPQGVTQSTRVGREAQIKSIQIKGVATYVPATDTIGQCTTYLYLVQDKQANGAAAAVTDVLTTTNLSRALINMSNSERFRIIRKWCHKLQAGAGVAAAYAQDSWNIDEWVPLNMSMEYSAGTGAITEIRSNNLFLIAGNDGTAGTDDNTSFSGECRVRFTDI